MSKRRTKRTQFSPSDEMRRRFDKTIEEAKIELRKEIRSQKDAPAKTVAYGVIGSLLAAFIVWLATTYALPYFNEFGKEQNVRPDNAIVR